MLLGWSETTAVAFNTLTANAPPKPEGVVYQAFDAAGVLLYIGSSDVRQYGARSQQHRRYAEWWPLAERIERETYPDRRAAFAAEREAIRRDGPVFNRSKTNGSAAECRRRIARYYAAQLDALRAACAQGRSRDGN